MLKNIVILFLLFITFSLSAQKASNLIDVSVSSTYEKITVTIKSGKDLVNDYRLKITNCEGKIVKSVKLQEKQLPTGNDVYIHDIGIGKYCFSIINGSKEIVQGEFTTDIYNEL